MRGWLLGLTLIVVLNGGAILYWHRDDGLWNHFENLDVRTILVQLEQPHQPLAWFTGDWVLGNGFYRPLPSLLYELDYRLWGRDLLQYKWTNGLLSLACALLLVGWVWEVGATSGVINRATCRSPLPASPRFLALTAGLVFTGWQTGLLGGVPSWLLWGVVLITLGISFWFIGDYRRAVTLGCLVLVLGLELGFVPNQPDLHQASFAYRAIGWIPGRTATLMTFFALLSLWAYARLCWHGHWGWGMLSLFAFAGALGSYEQAIALPFLLLITGLAIRAKGGRFVWWLPVLSLLLLELYLWFYLTTIPTQTEYHQQRLRRLYSLGISISNWLLPPLRGVIDQLGFALDAPLSVLLPAFWQAWLLLIAYLVVLMEVRRQPLAWLGLIGSALAYLPLAPVIPLMHYYYLPAAFRALWIAQLLQQLLLPHPKHATLGSISRHAISLPSQRAV